MTPQGEVDLYKNAYKDKTDAELIRLNREFVSHSPQAVAAELILKERKDKLEEARHREVKDQLAELKKPHWTTVPNFWITVVSALAAIVAAILAWLAWRQPVLH